MRSEVTMPRLSDTMSEGTVDRWLKKPGDRVERDEVIAEIQTDKATMELVAFESGTLDEIVVPDGGTTPIGHVIGWIRTAGDDSAAPTPAAASASPVAAPMPTQGDSRPAPAAAPSVAAAPAAATPAAAAKPGTPEDASGTRIKASPLARQVAKAHNIDLGAVQGTGPNGRILKENVDAFRARGPQAGQTSVAASTASAAAASVSADTKPGEIVPMTRINRATARTVSESKPGIPHIYLTVDIDMDAAMALRQQINDSGIVDVKITPNDLIVKVAARALVAHPQINSRYATTADGQPGLVRQDRINVNVAVATERGLLAPVVHDADKKGLAAIAAEIRELAGRARDGKSRQADLEGGTFQTSNLGMFGVKEFVSIISPPQAASLAIGAVRETPVARDGQLRIGQVMSVTLSVDHRVADGAEAARYLQELTRLLQSPLALLL